MPEIAEICQSCSWQKDGKCYGREPFVMAVWIEYPPCPTEKAQNGMPCPQWKEREGAFSVCYKTDM